MPPKQKAQAKTGNAGKRTEAGKSSSAAAAAAVPGLKVKASKDETDADLIPALAVLAPAAAAYPSRRARYTQRFKEVTELILSLDSGYRLAMRGRTGSEEGVTGNRGEAHSSGNDLGVGEDYFPTLQAGFIARAMGLNLTEEQVVLLVQLVEPDTLSRGSVSRRRLEGVVVDALMTGVLGGPTLVSSGVLSQAQMPAGWQPSCCLRSDEETIHRAFTAIDTAGKGYLTTDELRLAMTTLGDPLSTEEMEEMLVAMTEADSDAVYFRDFAEILARE